MPDLRWNWLRGYGKGVKTVIENAAIAAYIVAQVSLLVWGVQTAVRERKR